MVKYYTEDYMSKPFDWLREDLTSEQREKIKALTLKHIEEIQTMDNKRVYLSWTPRNMHKWKVEKDYVVNGFTVPAGFVCDMTSIPRS